MQDTSTRAGRTNSLNILMEYYWTYLSKITSAVQGHLGDQGTETLFDGLRRYGHFRGERMRNSAQICAEGRDALSLLRAWDVADLMLVSDGETMAVSGTPQKTTVHLSRTPGDEYNPVCSDPELLQKYWNAVLSGVAEGFDEDLTINLHERTVECTFSGDAANRSDATPKDTLADPTACIALSCSTLGDFAAMIMYSGQALLDRYDAIGEKVLREALYAFGLERAHAMRDAVLAEGKPLNFETWFDAIQ